MLSVLLPFAVMIGTLVFFHELGHFVAARAFGVKCLRFAVGMGPVVLSKVIWDTEFSIRALPLGGYVLMAGANPEEELEEHERGVSLADKPVWQRIIIFLAGPLVNILLPIPIMAMLLGAATQGPAPVVGWVAGGSPADVAGIMPGDEITSLNGEPVRFFDQVRDAVMEAGGKDLKVSLLREGKPLEVVVHPKAFTHADPLSKKRKVSGARIGLMNNRFASYIEVAAGSSAAAAGLATFDEVVSVNGKRTSNFLALREAMRAEQGPCKLVFVHPVPTTEKGFSLFVGTKREAVLSRCAAAIETEVASAESVLWEVTPGTPMAKAGLQRGDRIVSFDGRQVREFRSVETAMQEKPDQAYRLSYARAGVVTETTVTPTSAWTAGELNVKTLEVAIGGSTREGVDAGPMRDYTTGERLKAATVGAVTEVFSMTRSMAVGVFDLFTFQSDPSSLGGPMMMADFASRSAREGLAAFLFMMANISISLAMVNLVPIPGLDGGHILIGGVEAAMRRPLSFKARQIVSYAGVVAVVSLMAFAMVNDLKRYWDSFAHWLAS